MNRAEANRLPVGAEVLVADGPSKYARRGVGVVDHAGTVEIVRAGATARRSPAQYGLRVKMTTVPYEPASYSEAGGDGDRPNRWGRMDLLDPDKPYPWSSRNFYAIDESPAPGQVVIVPLRWLTTNAAAAAQAAERAAVEAARMEEDRARRGRLAANKAASIQTVAAAIPAVSPNADVHGVAVRAPIGLGDLDGLRALLQHGYQIQVAVMMDDDGRLLQGPR